MSSRLYLPHLLFFCDAESTLNLLQISKTYNSFLQSDLVKGYAYKSERIRPVARIPPQLQKLYLQYVNDKYNKENILYDDLQWAEKSGNIHVVKHLIKRGLNKSNLLRTACIIGQLIVVEYLFSIGTEPIIEYFNFACIEGHTEVVKCFMNHRDFYPVKIDFALSSAGKSGHLDVVKYLRQKGAEFDTEQLQDCINISVKNDRLDIVMYLIENCKADITANENMALITAVQCKRFEMAKFLIDNGADVSARGNTAIHFVPTTSQCTVGRLT